jgi:hypothetical protein
MSAGIQNRYCIDLNVGFRVSAWVMHITTFVLWLLIHVSRWQVRFLEYIRQWRKKVVFVINKADMLSSVDEVEQVKR